MNKNTNKRITKDQNLRNELLEVFNIENEDSSNFENVARFFEEARIAHKDIVVPKDSLYTLLSNIPEEERVPIRELPRVTTSWWRMGFILVPSALLLTLVFLPQYQHAQMIALPTTIQKPIDEIEYSLYSIEDDSELLEEERAFSIALAESDITSDFNQPFYEGDI